MSEETPKRRKISVEEFVEIWQKCNSVDEVVQLTGMSYGTVTTKATLTRRKGYELKGMSKKAEDPEVAAAQAELMEILRKTLIKGDDLR
jgi:hypothetical protein